MLGLMDAVFSVLIAIVEYIPGRESHEAVWSNDC